MIAVGLTGGIASGKSTVAAMFVALGAHLVDTDVLARQAVAPGGPALARIAAEFGPEALDANGNLDRAAMRGLAFGDQAARQRLEAIVHPVVAELAGQAMERHAAQDPDGVVLVDVPLLFEVSWDKLFARTVLVYAPAEVQLRRLMARDHCDEAAARAALQAQMPIEQKRKLAHFVIDNSGDMDKTQSQVVSVWRELCALATATPSRI